MTTQTMPNPEHLASESAFLNNMTEMQKKRVIGIQAEIDADYYCHFDAFGQGDEEESQDFADANVFDEDYWNNSNEVAKAIIWHINNLNSVCNTQYTVPDVIGMDASTFFQFLQYVYTDHGHYAYLSENMLEVYEPVKFEKHFSKDEIEDMLAIHDL